MERNIIEMKEDIAEIKGALFEKINTHDKRITALESNQAWIAKAIVGAVVVGVLAFIGL